MIYYFLALNWNLSKESLFPKLATSRSRNSSKSKPNDSFILPQIKDLWKTNYSGSTNNTSKNSSDKTQLPKLASLLGGVLNKSWIS